MAQFDVYTNPSSHSRKIYPYVMDIQHSVIEAIDTRMVVPLVSSESLNHASTGRLTPQVQVNDQKLLMMTTLMAALPKNILETPVTTLGHCRDEILAALDFALTGY